MQRGDRPSDRHRREPLEGPGVGHGPLGNFENDDV